VGLRVLRLIGYWDGPFTGEGWPDVRDFIDIDSDVEQRRAVAEYLRSGTAFAFAGGWSNCRVCDIRNGTTELTDGLHFVWPEGLAHYVEEHAVRLPDEVLAIAERGPAQIVDPAAMERAIFETRELAIADEWWRSLRRS
jgi:hypothetical protein